MEMIRKIIFSDEDLTKIMKEFEDLHNYPAVTNQLKKNYPTLFNFLCQAASRRISETLVLTFESRPPGSA